jgi:hypothetical protein
MAYPLTCIAGFNAPIRQGYYEIVGLTATVADSTAASQVAIVDDEGIQSGWKTGRILGSLESPTEVKRIIANIKGSGSAYDTVLEWWPAEAVKVRRGISMCFTNIEQGSLCLYVR